MTRQLNTYINTWFSKSNKGTQGNWRLSVSESNWKILFIGWSIWWHFVIFSTLFVNMRSILGWRENLMSYQTCGYLHSSRLTLSHVLSPFLLLRLVMGKSCLSSGLSLWGWGGRKVKLQNRMAISLPNGTLTPTWLINWIPWQRKMWD